MGKRRLDVDYLADTRLIRPTTREELGRWVSLHTPLLLPEHGTCPHHVSPLDYLAHTFFEESPPRDAVVWACRGGGKTMLGAVATLLDLVFKPGIQVRILGGSLEQSDKMYAYLRRLCAGKFADLLSRRPTRRRLELVNGSAAEILAQSDRAVRGTRVQKLRCDEVELFDPEVWEAAQLVTKCTGGEAGAAHGAIEALSTMHKPGGLMQQMIMPADARPAGEGGGSAPIADRPRRQFAWCVLDVIARCHPERDCTTCPLWDECGGRAKAADGFLAVDDVIAMKGRVSRATWNHEMLCHPPTLENAVFPGFARATHVRPFPLAARQPEPGDEVADHGRRLAVERVVAGVDFGFHVFVCLWMAMLRDEAGRRAVWVVDELVSRRCIVERNVEAVRLRPVPATFGEPRAEEPPEERAPWRPAVVYCDVAGNQTNSQTGRKDEAVLRAAGFRVKSSAMEVEAGLALLNELVDPALGGEGRPRLLIDPRCVELIAAFEGYQRRKDGGANKDGEHDHTMDALRYALVNHDRQPGKVQTRSY